MLHLKTVAGVMVTASHNPKQDNGYKVYWDNGCQVCERVRRSATRADAAARQIVSPHDKGISAQIDANQKPWFSVRTQVATLGGHALVVDATDECFRAYADAITADLCVSRCVGERGRARERYASECVSVWWSGRGHGGRRARKSADGFGCVRAQLARPVWRASHLLHGHARVRDCARLPPRRVRCSRGSCGSVGYPYVAEVFKRWGLPDLHVVAAQQWPDPEFPTVVFPNPQEGRGALELALRLAEEQHCDLILANDPDADRLAVAVRRAAGYALCACVARLRARARADSVLHSGEFVILNGNEIGYLFADWALRVYKTRGGDVARAAMVCSTVSSKFLARMASVDGFHFEETLTGFKWMGNRIVDLKAKGMSPLFAYEEAIGARPARARSLAALLTRERACARARAHRVGYLVGSNVYDKDGVSAAAVFAEMACDLHANKRCARRARVVTRALMRAHTSTRACTARCTSVCSSCTRSMATSSRTTTTSCATSPR